MENNFFDLSTLTLDANGRTEIGDADLQKLQNMYAGGQITPRPNIDTCIRSNTYCRGSNPLCSNSNCGGTSNTVECRNTASCGGTTNAKSC
jgi:hypothetical protein